jgi:hypothetical protein
MLGCLAVVVFGGSLSFGHRSGGDLVGPMVGDFTNPVYPGGIAGFFDGGLFAQTITPLVTNPAILNYVAATAIAPGSNIFGLVPLNLGNGFVMTGTITTDGATGVLATSDLGDVGNYGADRSGRRWRAPENACALGSRWGGSLRNPEGDPKEPARKAPL